MKIKGRKRIYQPMLMQYEPGTERPDIKEIRKLRLKIMDLKDKLKTHRRRKKINMNYVEQLKMFINIAVNRRKALILKTL